jgi:uncharacterized membrane protein YraQ (UPF0718 family)
MLTTFLLTVVGYLHELAEIVVVGFVVAGVINAMVNKEAAARYLGSSPVVANLLGATIGIVTPLCCCSAIPTAMALYHAGSRRGPACAFLIATPWFNWYGLAALLLFLGPRTTLAVAGSAVLIAFSAGPLIDLLGAHQVSRQTLLQPATESAQRAMAAAATGAFASPSCGCSDASCHVATASPDASPNLFDFSDLGGKLRQGVSFAISMLRELGLWMVLGVLLGAAIETFVPEALFTQYLGGASLFGLPAALVVAGIFSADSLGSLPWVQWLLTKGLGAGSAMILLVAGVGTNVSTLGPVGQVKGRRTAVWYAGSVVLLAAIFGFILNRVW